MEALNLTIRAKDLKKLILQLQSANPEQIVKTALIRAITSYEKLKKEDVEKIKITRDLVYDLENILKKVKNKTEQEKIILLLTFLHLLGAVIEEDDWGEHPLRFFLIFDSFYFLIKIIQTNQFCFDNFKIIYTILK